MHARIDELLALHDSPRHSRVAGHVEQCAECTERLLDLTRTRERLRALPLIEAPDTAWARIQSARATPNSTPSAVTGSRRGRLRRVAALAAAAGIAAFAFAIGFQLRGEGRVSAPSHTVRAPESPSSDDLAHLIEQSRELEAVLHTLPRRPAVERVSTAATIDTIEERIQWLDLRLSYASDSALSETQAQRLWRERVELMDSLVKVRYAQTGEATF